jgi:hypothetical protein
MTLGNDGYAPISLPENINVLPPSGPPVAFELAAVMEAMSAVCRARSHPLPYPQRRALEARFQFLTHLMQLAPPAGATARAQLFELVQDTVWWRRIVYFVSLLLALTAGGYPLLKEYLRIDAVDTLVGGPTGWAIGLLKSFLPGFAEPWLAAISRNPAGAVVIVVGLLISLRFSTFLQHRIHDRARAAWNVRDKVSHLRLTGQRHGLVRGAIVFGVLSVGTLLLGRTEHLWLFGIFALLTVLCLVLRIRFRPRPINPAQPGFLLGLARRARQSERAVAGYRFAAQTVAPALALGLGAIAIVSVAHRTSFDLSSTIGTFCTATEANDASSDRLGLGRPFSTNEMCHATGLRLTAGERYRITLDMVDDWYDKDVSTSIGGFSASSADSIKRSLLFPADRPHR